MPIVGVCKKCSGTTVNGVCQWEHCASMELLELTESKPDKFRGIDTQELIDEITRRGTLYR